MPLNAAHRDRLAGILCILFGVAAFALGLTYGVGTLRDMGAGFVPVATGVLLVLVGAAIVFTAAAPSPVAAPVEADHAHEPEAPLWRGWVCIIGGIIAFIFLAEPLGLAVASFVSVFIWAMGDRLNTLRSAAALAVLLTVFGAGLFYYGLGVQLPLFPWD